MLIHLDGSAVADAISASPTAARSHACIEDLLRARFEGSHVLSLLPGDAAALYTASWSRRERRALEDIDAKYAEVARLRKHVSWSLELGLGAGFDGAPPEVASGRTVMRASLHAFEPSHTTFRAALLGESGTDADFFVQLALVRRAERRWDALPLAHDARGAGGDTLASELERVADRGQIVLAIADSDRRHPSSGVGETYRKLETVARGRPAYQRARPLPTRTAEGLVPLSVYTEVFRAKPGDQRLGSVARLEPLLRSAPADVLRYAHLKDGIRLYQVQDPKTAAEGRYWGEIAAKVGRDQCNRPTSRTCTKREECQCFVVDGLGDHALSDVVAWMRTRRSKKDLVSRFGISQDPALCALADEVLAWGLALPPLLT